MSEHTHVMVSDVMSTSVRTIERMATVSEAIQVMREAELSSLVVERRDEHDEYGLLVVSDIAREVIGKERSPDRVNVYEVMSKPAVTVPGGMNIKYAISLLVRFRLSRALVLDDRRRPIGIVTLRDMVLRHTETDHKG